MNALGLVQQLAFSVPDPATLLGVSRGTVYALFASGALKTIGIGGRRMVRRADIDALLRDSAEAEEGGLVPLKPVQLAAIEQVRQEKAAAAAAASEPALQPGSLMPASAPVKAASAAESTSAAPSIKRRVA
jgi:excisionase family DNA binding protein